MIGKKINGDIYIHKMYVHTLHTDIQNMLKQVEPFIESTEVKYNIIKVSKRSNSISFLDYKDFDILDHPTLLTSVNINLTTRQIKIIDYSNRKNKPILHRKELLVGTSYPFYNKFVSITQVEEAAGYYKNTKLIGTELGWKKIIGES